MTTDTHVHRWKLEPPGADGRSWGECSECHETKWHGQSYGEQPDTYSTPVGKARMTQGVDERTCERCKRSLPLDTKHFVKNRHGFSRHCRDCSYPVGRHGPQPRPEPNPMVLESYEPEGTPHETGSTPAEEGIAPPEMAVEPVAVRVMEGVETPTEPEPDFLEIRMAAEGIGPRLYELYLSYQKDLDDKRIRYIGALIDMVEGWNEVSLELMQDDQQAGVLSWSRTLLDRIERLLDLPKEAP